jgi:hypothetical protein
VPIIIFGLVLILAQIIFLFSCISFFQKKRNERLNLDNDEGQVVFSKKEMVFKSIKSTTIALSTMAFIWWPLFGPIYKCIYTFFGMYFSLCSMTVNNCIQTHHDFNGLKDKFDLFSHVNYYQIYAILIGAPFVVALTFLREYK